MPKEKTQGNVTVQSQNDNATQRVPENEKKGFCSIAFVAAGYCICMSGLYTGAAMGFGMNFKEAILAVIVGNVILSVYGGLIGAAGAREGVNLHAGKAHLWQGRLQGDRNPSGSCHGGLVRCAGRIFRFNHVGPVSQRRHNHIPICGCVLGRHSDDGDRLHGI